MQASLTCIINRELSNTAQIRDGCEPDSRESRKGNWEYGLLGQGQQKRRDGVCVDIAEIREYRDCRQLRNTGGAFPLCNAAMTVPPPRQGRKDIPGRKMRDFRQAVEFTGG